MVYFLERIAKHLYEEYNGDLRDHCLVFPGRRAGLYFLKYLSDQIDKPVWAPAIMTINEFVSSFSELQVAENELLLFELYKVYNKLNKTAGSFDEFYFWGDMLVSDFDDIDKYLADASGVFRNIKDFKNLDIQFGDLDKEQVEIIKRFWKNFEPEKITAEKSDFKFIWSFLYDLYSEFKNSLRSKNIAYEGMIFRDVVTNVLPWKNPWFKWKQVHFIGFNALNKCEETLMKKLQDEGLAKFYWDYDNSYIKGGKLNSAGMFLAADLRKFNNDMPGDWSYDTFLSENKNDIIRNVIETTSDIAQVKLLPFLIEQLAGISKENAHHTVIILADESLLLPALTSLPSGIGDINITMGFPLKMTNVYGLVKSLLNLQRDITFEDGTLWYGSQHLEDIYKNQLIERLLNDEEKKIIDGILRKNLTRVPSDILMRSDILKTIFRKPKNPADFSEYLKDLLASIVAIKTQGENQDDVGMQYHLMKEFIYRILLCINRLEMILSSSEIDFKTETYIRLLDKIIRNQTAPFSGEPLSGIQIMGILETRALDFKNIIMLSVNEGILPSVSVSSSFIPYSIREAFGLPVINHQESIFAYHFYRLLHRSENVTMVYNSNSEGLRTGEMSRFLIQMKYEQVIKPEILNLSFDIKTPVSIGNEIEKNFHHLSLLNTLYINPDSKAVLSPTALNTWLNCRMKFYYRYVNGLKEPDTSSSEIDHAVFGKLLHRIMKRVYEPFTGKEITMNSLKSLSEDKDMLLSVIDEVLNENFGSGIKRPLNGNELIIKDILNLFLLRIMNADKMIAPFRIIALETRFDFMFQVRVNGETAFVRTGGNIDRIDFHSGKVRIVDYKTGEIIRKINSVSDLFVDDRKKELDGWLQTLLYCEAYYNKDADHIIKPSVYKVKELSGEKIPDDLKIRMEGNNEVGVTDYLSVREEFLNGLGEVMATIFSLTEPFRMTENTGKCVYCPYRRLCQR